MNPTTDSRTSSSVIFPHASPLSASELKAHRDRRRNRQSEKETEMESSSHEEDSEGKVEFEASEVEYTSYGGEHHLPLIMGLVDQELSEPYSIFTYRYFVYLWPQLSFLVSTFTLCFLLP